MIAFIVPGDPKGLKRHRTFRLKNGFNVNVDASKNDKENFLVIAMRYRPEVPLDEPLRLLVTAYFKRPNDHYGTRKKVKYLKDNQPVYHTGTPDADNILKFVGDALNGTFWRDDKVIASASILKYYTEGAPRVVVEISTLTEKANA